MVKSPKQRLIDRLPEAIRSSRERHRGFRKNVKRCIDQYIGGNYCNHSVRRADRTPVNMFKLEHDITVRQLAARTPKVRVDTTYMDLRPTAYELELSVDFVLDRIQFGRTQRGIVQDAFFGMGIAKTGVCGEIGLMYGSGAHFSEIPFVDRVSMDDWVHDARARRWEDITFCGNQYIETRWSLEASGLFDDAELKKLTRSNDDATNSDDGSPRISSASSGRRSGDSAITEFYEFWDIWIPSEGKIVTLQLDDGRILREVDWYGDVAGPYDILSFGMVPDSILPISPAASKLDTEELLNSIYRKLGRQASRQKSITVVQKGSDEDAKLIRESSDGDMIGLDNPAAAHEIRYGGPDAASLQMGVHIKDIRSYLAGNLDARGGLSPQGDTATQAKLLSDSSSGLDQDMQDETLAFTTRRIRDIARFMWQANKISIPIVKRDANEQPVEPTKFTPKSRSGDFFDFSFSVEPYSMRSTSPMQKLMAIERAIDRAAMMGPFLQQQGITIDLQPYFDEYAKVLEIPVLNQIIRSVGRSEQMSGGGEEMPDMKPASTNRTYTRINRPGATQGQKDQALMTMLGGKGIQASENTTARATG